MSDPLHFDCAPLPLNSVCVCVFACVDVVAQWKSDSHSTGTDVEQKLADECSVYVYT